MLGFFVSGARATRHQATAARHSAAKNSAEKDLLFKNQQFIYSAKIQNTLITPRKNQAL
jgi:hypothetical protein